MLERIQLWLGRIGIGGGVILALLYVTFCAYSLPRTAVVRVTGNEVTRRDTEQRDGTTRVADIKYVTAEDLDGTPRLFRNVDTGLGWPPYFKFDSGDVLAQANGLSRQDPPGAAHVRYYGFRNRMFSLAPNLVSIRAVRDGDPQFPVFNTVFAAVNVIAFGYGYYRIRKWRKEGENATEGSES